MLCNLNQLWSLYDYLAEMISRDQLVASCYDIRQSIVIKKTV